MSTTENKTLEIKVGAFLMIGVAVICGLAITFGRLGERIAASYTIVVEFPNASGLLKGSKVLYAGAPVGRVLNSPKPIKGGRAVEVELRIEEVAQIRQDAKFIIGSSGLLGDRFVDVQPQGEEAPYLKDGDRLEKGQRTAGIGDLTEDAKPIIEDIKRILLRLQNEVLTPETTADTREAIKKLRSVLTRTDDLLAQAQRGQGPLAKILNDKKAAEDLGALISNLRRNGVLFYKDDAAQVDPKEKKKK
jgi:phospholipid/cholesterol/gamma-HCH transport system substrate-binding protein